MPKPMLERMLSGALTPLIELKFKNDEGRELNVPVKLRLERQPNGTVEPRVYPVSDHIARPKGLEIKDSEMERLKRGEVVSKSIREIGDDGPALFESETGFVEAPCRVVVQKLPGL